MAVSYAGLNPAQAAQVTDMMNTSHYEAELLANQLRSQNPQPTPLAQAIKRNVPGMVQPVVRNVQPQYPRDLRPGGNANVQPLGNIAAQGMRFARDWGLLDQNVNLPRFPEGDLMPTSTSYTPGQMNLSQMSRQELVSLIMAAFGGGGLQGLGSLHGSQ